MDQWVPEEDISSNGDLWEDYGVVNQLGTGQSVQGRLKANSNFCSQELEASSFVQGIVTHGYILPFISLPVPVFCTNHASTLGEAEFVAEEIAKLVAASCVLEVPYCPEVCSPLLVVNNSKGKKRLVLDLRMVNKHLLKRKFKYEGINLIPDMCSRGDYFVTFDLRSGYHHVDIHPECWTYLGFSWLFNGIRRFFVYKVLPFGLSTACYVFTKLLRPLVKRWRFAGLRVILYIDDGFCVGSTAAECGRGKEVILNDLDRAGFVLNFEKSQLVSQQVGVWLGFTIDLAQGVYQVTQERVVKLKEALGRVDPYGDVPIRFVASIVGQIISMGLAIGPITRLRTRCLYEVINCRRCWSDRLRLSDGAREELNFWERCVDSLNGRPIWFMPGVSRIVYSDASSTGFGGYVVELCNEVSNGLWSVDEASQSSTWRELKAVYNVLLSFATKLEGHKVKWLTDNQGVQYIISSGSKKSHLQEGALAIFEVCLSHSIRLEVEWIPRKENERADYISRIVDVDDWMVDPMLFQQLDALWGPHTVDCFASFYNAQLPRFFSRCWNPHSEAVDAFTVSWEGEVCWWAPPLHLVIKVLKHARACRAMGTLFVPAWASAPFWPLLCPDGQKFAFFIKQWVWVKFHDALLRDGRSGNNIGQALSTDSFLVALYLDFREVI